MNIYEQAIAAFTLDSNLLQIQKRIDDVPGDLSGEHHLAKIQMAGLVEIGEIKLAQIWFQTIFSYNEDEWDKFAKNILEFSQFLTEEREDAEK